MSALFTNVPLKETIGILVDKAFDNDWFNETHSMQLQKHQLTELLEIAASNQLFQFNGELYEQTDGVAMGSPLGPLLANVFMCHSSIVIGGTRAKIRFGNCAGFKIMI